MILIDNDDSFTYNIVHALAQLGHPPQVIRSRDCTVEEVLAKKPSHLVVGPGPGAPPAAGISKALIEQASCPILGICLGHQAIGEVYGARVERAPKVMHGKSSQIFHRGKGIFSGIPTPFEAIRYHSLIVKGVSSNLEITAWTEEGEVMGLAHQTKPLFGVQFHPESIASHNGEVLLKNFCGLKSSYSARDVHSMVACGY
ncbi:MAG: Anthranilate synthase component 2 [Chlamydiales bacterium]|nr:Anthranilate synthase component 2 [Chlamydiales bacterium]